MADYVNGFTEIDRVLVHGNNLGSFYTNCSISAGQAVALYGSGATLYVTPCLGTDKPPIGVAVFGNKSGGLVTIAMAGTICKVEALTNVSAGDMIGPSNTSGGFVASKSISGNQSWFEGNGSVALRITEHHILGYALENFAALGVGRVYVHPMTVAEANLSRA